MITGTAAGVPFLARPPQGGARPDAPVVVAWHLLDAPRTAAAFAAAVPLAGLDAWRVYLGLPLTGDRLPEGGLDELRRRSFADPVEQLYRHVVGGAVAEFPAAFAELRSRLGIDPGPVGVLGGSMGGLVAQTVLADSGLDVRAAVLVNPVVRVRDTIDGLAAVFGTAYEWAPGAAEFAARHDFVARSAELTGAALLYVTGEDDFPAAIVRPVVAVVDELRRRDATVSWRTIPGMGHALAAEPGVDPAPQTPHAAEVDALAVAWFTAHLPGAAAGPTAADPVSARD